MECAPHAARRAVHGQARRRWTDLDDGNLARLRGLVRLAVRVLCASLPFADAPIAFSRPRIVLDLAKNFVLRDARPISDEPWKIQSIEDLADLYILLVDPTRSLPVYLLTQPDPHRFGRPVRDYLLDAAYFARKLQGLGTVVTLPRELNAEWTDYVGKTWSAFMGAVRTYLPALTFDEDRPTNHPLALAHRIVAFERDGRHGEDAFTDFVIDQALVSSATKATSWLPCLFYADALQRDVELARSRAKDDGDWKQVYEAEVLAVKKQAEQAEGLAASYAEDVDTLKNQLDEVVEERRKFTVYVAALRAQLEAKTGRSPDATVTLPATYDDLPEWVEDNLPGRLILHPRAHRALKSAVYEDPPLVYKALLALGKQYRDMRLREADDDAPRLAWERELGELDLRCDGSISKERAGEEGDAYFVKYPIGSSKSRFMDLHLRKGKTKDDAVCLAIYFWDDENERVVVGWLPSHLDKRLT